MSFSFLEFFKVFLQALKQQSTAEALVIWSLKASNREQKMIPVPEHRSR
nr:hypothetical protein [Candidatus Mycoplasma haematolamae]